MSEETPVRINKFLSEAGYCSRRHADELIAKNRVTINGKVPELGTKITSADVICVDGVQILAQTEKPVYIAFNKPVGIVCTTDTKREKNNIIDFLKYPKRIFPIGRLDKPSEGLIFLTNDGEYNVKVDKPVNSAFIKAMAAGVPILDTVTRECYVRQTGKFEFKIILTQGLNRQIRRMCEYLGYDVIKLKRVRIMNIKLDVPVGQWRYFTEQELKDIQRLVATSKKTFEAHPVQPHEDDHEE
jgi:23S rRNA pseudouridine2604 synthase